MNIDYVQNPNYLGEEFRDQCFLKLSNGVLGGVDAFALQQRFVKVNSSDPIVSVISDLFVRVTPSQGPNGLLLSKTSFDKREYNNFCNEVSKTLRVFSDGNIVVAWDSDLKYLLFSYNGRAVLNTDCRKEFGWQWVKI